jgi:beta-N-acetylhexosaminidase
MAADRAAVVRRRRVALVLFAALAFAVGVALGSSGDDAPEEGTDAAAPPSPPSCPERIAGSARRLVGQLLMVRMEATATDGLVERVRNAELGGVILFPPEGTAPAVLGAEVATLRRAAKRAGAPAPLVATDQEGGEVERLPELPPERSAPELGSAGARAAADEGRATGAALRELGIDVDLAPVLDVPAVDDAFIASRSFSDDPQRAGELGVAFGEGLQAEGVAATAKHFPGLGLAVENTDLVPSPIDASRAEIDSGLSPFEAAIEASFGLVMIANATYPALDPDRPASQSRRVVTRLLRDDLGYEGVIITDDLGAGAITGAGIDEATAAVGAVKAGADLALVALTDGTAAADALLQALRAGELDRAALEESCARVTALRERLAGGEPVS